MAKSTTNIFIKIIIVLVVIGFNVGCGIKSVHYSSGSYTYITDTLMHDSVKLKNEVGEVIFWHKNRKIDFSDFKLLNTPSTSEKYRPHLKCNTHYDFCLSNDTFMYQVTAFMYPDSSMWLMKDTTGYSTEKLKEYNVEKMELLQSCQILFNTHEVEARYMRRFLSLRRNFNEFSILDDSLANIHEKFEVLRSQFVKDIHNPSSAIEKKRWMNNVNAEMKALQDFENPAGCIIKKQN